MAIHYDDITNEDKLEIADMLSKMSSIDALREVIQANRDTAEETWKSQDGELQTEKENITKLMRAKRQVNITGSG